MAFTYALDPTTPAGGEAASLGDDRIREFKNAVIERLQQIVDDYTVDPYALELDNRTYTTDKKLIQGTVTWNAAGVTFTAVQINVTSTASAAGSLLLNLLVGGSSMWKVDKLGAWVSAAGGTITTGGLTITAGTLAAQALTATTIVTSSTINSQTISSAANFTGTLAVAGKLTSTVGSEAIKLVPTAGGTYGSAEYIGWYRANGSTLRGYVGYGAGDDQNFDISTQESGGILRFQAGAAVTALTLTATTATIALATTAVQALTATTAQLGGAALSKILAIQDTANTNTAQVRFKDLSASVSFGYIGNFSDSVYLTVGGTYTGSWASDNASKAIASIALVSGNADSSILLQTVAANNSGPVTRVTIAKDGFTTFTAGISATTGAFSGIVGIGSAPSASNGLFLNGNITSGSTTQTGVNIQPTFGTGATSAGYAAYLGVTATGAFTMSDAVGIRVLNATANGGATITNQIGIQIDAMTTGGTSNWSIKCSSGNVHFRDSALATGATTGHLFIPTSAGAPTGVPASIPTGQVALQYDSTNNFLYLYSGGWKKSTVYA